MRTISHDSHFSDAFTEQRHPHTSISRGPLFALFAGSCARPRAKRFPKRAQTGLKPDALFAIFAASCARPGAKRLPKRAQTGLKPDALCKDTPERRFLRVHLPRRGGSSLRQKTEDKRQKTAHLCTDHASKSTPTPPVVRKPTLTT